MRRFLPLLLAAAAAALAACSSLSDLDAGEIVADIAEFLGQSRPGRHVERLDRLHDTATFRHVPDLPPTVDACLAEVRVLAESDYAAWRDVALATYLVTRVASEDPAALNRGEAVRALERLGGMVLEVEDLSAPAESEDSATRAIKRLREIHDRETGRHRSPEAAAECPGMVRVLGGFRMTLPPDALEAEVRYALRMVRGTLMAVVVETGAAVSHGDGDSRGGADRAVVNLAGQAVRHSLASVLRFDGTATVRADAARVLGRIGPPGTAAVLRVAYARERDGAVRREVLLSLVRTLDRGDGERAEAVPALIAALSDDDPSTAYNARVGLRGLAGEDLGPEQGPWIRWWGREGAGAGR